MDDIRKDGLEALRDSIVAHLERLQLELYAHMDGIEHRLTRRLDAVDARLDSVDARLDSVDARLDSVDARLDSLRSENAERSESADQRFRAMETRLTLFENKHAERIDKIAAELAVVSGEVELLRKQAGAISASIDRLAGRLDPLETAVSGWAASTAGLGEDVKQRFRVVNERLTAIEQRLAA